MTYYGALTPIILSGQSLIDINNVSYLEIQHIKLDWYDGYGVRCREPAITSGWRLDRRQPSAERDGADGFYVHPSGTPGDNDFYNTDSHRNYVGYRFDGTATPSN